jgi:hypothetical protein
MIDEADVLTRAYQAAFRNEALAKALFAAATAATDSAYEVLRDVVRTLGYFEDEQGRYSMAA